MRFWILRTLHEFFKIDFQIDPLRKVFYFKIKEINLKTTKHKKTKYQAKQKKTKSQSKFLLFILFLVINKTNKSEDRGQSS